MSESESCQGLDPGASGEEGYKGSKLMQRTARSQVKEPQLVGTRRLRSLSRTLSACRLVWAMLKSKNRWPHALKNYPSSQRKGTALDPEALKGELDD